MQWWDSTNITTFGAVTRMIKFIYVNSPHHYHTRKVNFIGTSGYIIVHLVTIFVILEYIQTLAKLHCTFWWQAETMVTLNCLVDKAVAVS